MNKTETERLTRVEDQQRETTQQLAELRADMKANTLVTNSINSKLDNLSGGKQALMWLLGLMVAIGMIIATVAGYHK